MATAAKPGLRPANPRFSSGPCAKRPGWTLDALSGAFLGRSHRAAGPKARLAEVIEHGGPQLRDLVRAFTDPGKCADAVAAALVMDADARQELIEACDPMVRLQRTLGHVSHMLCELAPCDGAVN